MTGTYPAELSYSDDHEWIAVPPGADTPADPVRVGVTSFAVDLLGDLVFIELPGAGATLAAGEVCGEIESTKAVSELFSPVAGQVVEVNPALADNPSLVSEAPFGEGWLFTVRVTDLGELKSAEDYAILVAGAKERQ